MKGTMRTYLEVYFGVSQKLTWKGKSRILRV
jgi:hypothetical protein